MGMGLRRRYVRQAESLDWDESALKWYVYRLSDGDGVNLYVGRSQDPRIRLTGHRAASEWAHSVRQMDVWGPYSWRDVCEAERTRIEAERPLHNRMFVS